MPGLRRWTVFTVGVLLVIAVPLVVAARPVRVAEISPSALLEQIRAADDVAYTGYVQSRGGVELPSDDSLAGVAKLVGGSGSIRVWWAGPQAWRVATLRTTGETDLLHREGRNLRWVYESKRVTFSPEVPVRLPNSSDVLPPVLARRVLQGARAVERSLPARRVAGRDARGLRFTPEDPQASIDHVDVWSEEETGLAVRVELHPERGPAALTTAFSDLTIGDPEGEALSFRPPSDAEVVYQATIDVAAAADRYADRSVPGTLAGLPARASGVRSVGVYGRGPTALLAVPLREGDAEDLRSELRGRPGAVCLPEGDAIASGPVQLLVTAYEEEAWLVAGTVTRHTVRRAADDLVPFSRASPGPLPVGRCP